VVSLEAPGGVTVSADSLVSGVDNEGGELCRRDVRIGSEIPHSGPQRQIGLDRLEGGGRVRVARVAWSSVCRTSAQELSPDGGPISTPPTVRTSVRLLTFVWVVLG
jgi:hypothetical protein